MFKENACLKVYVNYNISKLAYHLYIASLYHLKP